MSMTLIEAEKENVSEKTQEGVSSDVEKDVVFEIKQDKLPHLKGLNDSPKPLTRHGHGNCVISPMTS